MEEAARQSNWIPYAQLLAITERTVELLGGPEEARVLATDVAFQSDGVRAIQRLARAFTSPKNMYLATARWVSRQLFTVITYSYRDRGRNQCELILEFEDGHVPTPAIVALFAGTYEGLPRALGYPPASIQTECDGQVVRFHIATPRSGSALAWLQRLVLAPFAGWGLFQELEQQSMQLELRLNEIADAREEVMRAAELRAAFLATISTELRAPLDVISDRTSNLMKSDLAEAQHELVLAQHQSAVRLRSLVDKMMDFIEVSNADYRPDVSGIDVQAFLAEVEAAARDIASKAGVALVVFAMTPGVVIGSAERLHTVLLSLVENAVRHGGAAKIWIDARHEDERWIFDVRDDGVGMDEERAARLFEPLVQGEASLRRLDNNIGLSAAIAQRVVEAMGGRIRCESASGAGTTVTVDLPAAELAAV